jgi:hypothetical protein
MNICTVTHKGCKSLLDEDFHLTLKDRDYDLFTD